MAFRFSTPSEYAFDDTPKAFKRLMQRKSDMFDGQKKSSKIEQFTPEKRKISSSDYESKSSNKKEAITTSKDKDASNKNDKYSSSSSSFLKKSVNSGFKTIRAKRKSHLQARDLKKKLKRLDNELEHSNSALKRHVRDVVQEPPKLKSVKKSFKKVLDESVELKSWSESDNDYSNDDLE